MEYLKIWVSFREVTECLADDEKGRLFDAMMAYAETGEEPELKGNERFVWPCARQNIRKAAEECGRLRVNGRKGGRPRREAEAVRTETKHEEATKKKCLVQDSAVAGPGADKEYREDDAQADCLPDLSNVLEDREAEATSLPYTVTDEGEPVQGNGPEEGAAGVEVPPVRLFGLHSPDDLTAKVQRELTGLTDTHRDSLREYRRRLGDELVEYAVDAAVAHGVRSWAYVERILQNYVKENISSVSQAKAANEKRRTRGTAHYTLERDDGVYDRMEAELSRELFGEKAG